MTASIAVKTVRCHGCRRFFDVARMLRGTGSTLYCTKVCLVHEAKTFAIPTPRKAA